jgi:predicted O-methyltransferase YrrM
VSRLTPRRVRAKLATYRPFPQLRVLRTYSSSARREPRAAISYLFTGRETSNFTYDIANRDEVASVLARALDAPVDAIAAYIAELDGDQELSSALEAKLRQHRDRNPQPHFGRRVGWYAVVRWLKPRLVVETGTADGLGTATLARGLERNEAEGSPGELLSFDVQPDAGWLLGADALRYARVVVGDSTETLPRELAGRHVDVFVHDSAHTYEHERMEFALALEHAARRIVLISDNAHATTALADVAREHGAPFAFVREQPVRHFYPGAGIGIATVNGG